GANIGNAPHGGTAFDSATRARTFRSRNQLQQFLRIIQPIPEFRAERLRSNLRSHADLTSSRIGSYKLDLVNADAGLFAVPQGRLDFFSDILRFGATDGKCADQLGKVIDCNLIRKMDTGQPGRREKLGEAALRLPGFESHAVQQKAILRDSQQEPA